MSETEIKFILGIDPGETSGFASYIKGPEGWSPSNVVDIKKGEIVDYISKIQMPDVIVCEEFITNPKVFDRTFQKHFTIRVIGALELRAYQLGIPMVMQMPGDKYPACGRLFRKPYKRTKNHHFDALLHAGWYLLQNGEKVISVK